MPGRSGISERRAAVVALQVLRCHEVTTHHPVRHTGCYYASLADNSFPGPGGANRRGTDMANRFTRPTGAPSPQTVIPTELRSEGSRAGEARVPCPRSLRAE